MKNKKYLILIITAIVILLVGGILFFVFKEDDTETDAIKFAKEYTLVGEDNVFVYRNAEEVIKLLKNGTGVVYLGFPECPWCQTYSKYLNEVAKEVGVDKIYYYDILEDRANNTDVYKEIISLLGDNLQYDEEGNHRVYVPNVSFHVNGEIVGNDNETSLDTKGFSTPEEYWNDEEVTELKNTLTTYMEKVYTASNMCTTCNR